MANFSRSDDVLTRIRDSKAMEELLKYEAVRFNRSGKPFSILLAEIDNFDEIIELHGVESTQKVKDNVASILNSLSRDQDIVAPWDGTLNIMLLPDTTSKGVQIVGEKMRSSVEVAVAEHDDNKLSATVTIGVSTIDKKKSIMDALENAYFALQRGRNLGRNRVEVAHFD